MRTTGTLAGIAPTTEIVPQYRRQPQNLRTRTSSATHHGMVASGESVSRVVAVQFSAVQFDATQWMQTQLMQQMQSQIQFSR